MAQTYNNKLVVKTAPTEEPVSLTEAKLYLKVEYDDDDTLLSDLIQSARERCELEVWRTFCTTQYTLSFDRFPNDQRNWSGSGYYSAIVGSTDYWSQVSTTVIKLPTTPVTSIDEIRYKAMGDTDWTVLDPTLYNTSLGTPGKVMPVNGTIFPITALALSSVEIDFTAGYGAADDVPASAKMAIRQIVSYLYENRTMPDSPPPVQSLWMLDTLRWGGYA